MGRRLDRFLVLCYTNGFLSQLILLGVPLWFAVILSFRSTTFDGSTAYTHMEQLMSETGWAWLSFVCFLVPAVLYYKGTYPAKIAANGILAFWHGLIAMLIFLSAPSSTGSGTYAILAAGSTLRLLALTNNYRKKMNAG